MEQQQQKKQDSVGSWIIAWEFLPDSSASKKKVLSLITSSYWEPYWSPAVT